MVHFDFPRSVVARCLFYPILQWYSLKYFWSSRLNKSALHSAVTWPACYLSKPMRMEKLFKSSTIQLFGWKKRFEGGKKTQKQNLEACKCKMRFKMCSILMICLFIRFLLLLPFVFNILQKSSKICFIFFLLLFNLGKLIGEKNAYFIELEMWHSKHEIIGITWKYKRQLTLLMSFT